MNETNVIDLSGVVSQEPVYNHEVFGENFFQFYLSSIRMSENIDVLPVLVSERLIDLDSLKVGTYVHVKGQVRTFSKHTDDGARPSLLISVFTKEICIPDEPFKNDVNEVTLNGYICKTPVERATPLGREICDVLVAVNRPYGKSDYIPCIAWGRNAKYVGELEVGTALKLTGRLQSRNYNKKIDDTNFEQRTAYEMSVSKLEVINN